MKDARGEAGAVRVRTLVECFVIFLIAYVAVQVAPIVVLRVSFLNELQVAASSPVDDTVADVKRTVLDAAEGYGIALLSEDLHVQRDRERSKTVIDATYQLHINFWPRFTYVWNVRDHVEALLY